MSRSIAFDEQCRLCLDNPGVISIFETQDFRRDIVACTGVKIFPSDNLPQKICSMCSEIVRNAARLRQIAVKSDETLKMFVKDVFSDDSRDTLCISPMKQSVEHCDTFLSTSESPEDKGEDLNHEDSLLKKRKLNVRNDLFDSASSTTKKIIVVRSKDDYDKAKKKIKTNPDYNMVFECEPCEKKFKTWKKLYQHLRHHEKKYFCPIDVCGKRFATKGDLEKHLRTHTGVKPFACDICDKSFTQQGALKVHKETVHFCFTVH